MKNVRLMTSHQLRIGPRGKWTVTLEVERAFHLDRLLGKLGKLEGGDLRSECRIEAWHGLEPLIWQPVNASCTLHPGGLGLTGQVARERDILRLCVENHSDRMEALMFCFEGRPR